MTIFGIQAWNVLPSKSIEESIDSSQSWLKFNSFYGLSLETRPSIVAIVHVRYTVGQICSAKCSAQLISLYNWNLFLRYPTPTNKRNLFLTLDVIHQAMSGSLNFKTRVTLRFHSANAATMWWLLKSHLTFALHCIAAKKIVKVLLWSISFTTSLSLFGFIVFPFTVCVRVRAFRSVCLYIISECDNKLKRWISASRKSIA